MSLNKKKYEEAFKTLSGFMDKNYKNWKADKDCLNLIKKAARRQAKGKSSGLENIVVQATHYLNTQDKIEISEQKDIKQICIKKEKYEKEWPFTSDKVYIKQTEKIFVTCLIDGKEYALNGTAHDKYKGIKFPHECGKAVIGKTVGDFINIGLRL